MSIKMKYPIIKGNDLCDGSVHEISVYGASRIEDYNLFLLDYYDNSFNCDANTILFLHNGNYYKIPLENYDSFFQNLNDGIIELHPVAFGENGVPPLQPNVNCVEPVKDFSACLTKTRACIILYIDNDGKIYTKINGNVSMINGNQLSAIMQDYDIEWRMLETNSLASSSKIGAAISKNFPRQDGLSYKGRLSYGNNHICHYSVSYYLKDENGIIRGSSSI